MDPWGPEIEKIINNFIQTSPVYFYKDLFFG